MPDENAALIILALAIAGGLFILLAARQRIIDRLARKHLGLRAKIPKELDVDYRHYPEGDPEQVALQHYSPNKAAVPSIVPFRFSDIKSELLEHGPSPAQLIAHIDSIAAILWMESEPSYAYLFNILSRSPNYATATPSAPSAPREPPGWTPRSKPLPSPSFVPPYYSGRLSFLNGLVTRAYASEISNVALALEHKKELEEGFAKRDQEVNALWNDAQKRWKNIDEQQQSEYASVLANYKGARDLYVKAFLAEKTRIQIWHDAANQPGPSGVLCRIDLTIRTTKFPPIVSREAQTRFDAASGVLIHEHRFPDLASLTWVKNVTLKSGTTEKPATQKEQREASAKLWPSLCLRLASEIARLDTEGIVKGIAINGWADYTDPATGQEKRAYCASMFATKEQIEGLNLWALDPIAAFNKLKGVAAPQSLELTPIAPIVRLDTSDPRFVDPKEVLSRMAEGENIAAMGWEDFEHLCRELFERAFAASGAEVKVTQASRDQGVDAIIFDPDPLRGGKIVVQAKRYTNTVDVSAVRDLYGAVLNEGAIKGILVTTSHYGPDAYSFAKDKPLTLLNGRELLGLLERHGYKFRIDLAEARKMI